MSATLKVQIQLKDEAQALIADGRQLALFPLAPSLEAATPQTLRLREIKLNFFLSLSLFPYPSYLTLLDLHSFSSLPPLSKPSHTYSCSKLLKGVIFKGCYF